MHKSSTKLSGLKPNFNPFLALSFQSFQTAHNHPFNDFLCEILLKYEKYFLEISHSSDFIAGLRVGLELIRK